MAANLVGGKDFARGVGRILLGRGLPFLGRDAVGLRTTASVWNVSGKYGPHGELFLFLIKMELTRAVEFKPFVTAETLKTCALTDWLALDGRRKRLCFEW